MTPAIEGQPAVTLPTALLAPANSCTARDAAKLGKHDPLIALVRLESANGSLYALALIAGFQLRMPAGGVFDQGVLYQLDDGPPTLISLAASKSDVNFLSLRFGRIALGPHRFSVALIAASGNPVSYEQRCFTITSTEPNGYDITRLPASQRDTP